MTRRTLPIVLLVMSSGIAHDWQYEQVDSGGNWKFVELEYARDGRPFLCYADVFTRRVTVAWKDTVWHMSSPGIYDGGIDRHLALRPDGWPSVVVNRQPVRLAEQRDSGWDTASVEASGSSVFLTYDSLGEPGIAWTFFEGSPVYEYGLATTSRVAGTWVTETLWFPQEGMYPDHLDRIIGFVTDGCDEFGTAIRVSNAHGGYWWQWLVVKAGRSRRWYDYMTEGGLYWDMDPLSLAPIETGGFAVCYNGGYNGLLRFYCCGTILDSAIASFAHLRVDRQCHAQVIYRTGSLFYAWSSNGWHIERLPGALDAPLLDFAVDGNGTPAVAFIRPEGVFLARGSPTEACEELPGLASPIEPRIAVAPVGVAPVRIGWRGPSLSIQVRNSLGRGVRRLVIGNGTTWDGRDDHGRPVAGGVYFLVPREPQSGTRILPARFVLAR